MVSLGQPVSKGQPLALIQSADYATAIAAYRKAAVTAANARRLAVADRDLAAHNGISQREATQAQTDAASAEADRLAALQALLSLGVDRGTVARALAGSPVAGVAAVIRAPVSGIVVEKQITPGQLLQAGSTAAFTVANLSQLWVLAQIAPSDLSASASMIRRRSIRETALGHSMARSTISPPRSTKTLARSWRASSCPIPPTCSRSKCTSHVSIESGRVSTGLLVPVSAVLRDDENLPFVYVGLADGSFARRHVTLGYRDSQNYAVTSGLQSGERIVTNGALFLQFMQSQ